MSQNLSFFVINGTMEDKEEVHIDGLEVEWCAQYMYTWGGSPFTADGSVSSSVRTHAAAKMAHVTKFISFLKKNNDLPFRVRKRVFEACVMSAILYGCESWLDADLRPVVKLYNWSLKNLLDVRLSACKDVCYIESAYPPLHPLVKSKQRKFFCKMWNERVAMEDDPSALSLRTVMDNQYRTQAYINELLLHANINDIEMGFNELKTKLLDSNSSRRIVYKDLNPNLSVHSAYNTKCCVTEHHRVATHWQLKSEGVTGGDEEDCR